MSAMQTGLSCTPVFHDASRLHVFIPGVVGVAVESLHMRVKLSIDSGVVPDGGA
ncbi:hypothetical protein [Candidatus Methylomirabilis limnetica]|uniref:hypothetical protein n=1 Tax=Candidatus Methylomirabilis limnetica TaxID=2033718 RepID=UPI001379D0DE|nr:hypothetical protein [Candidatus Methylomirabilis limnetica]